MPGPKGWLWKENLRTIDQQMRRMRPNTMLKMSMASERQNHRTPAER
jgi:hypothetical protein